MVGSCRARLLHIIHVSTVSEVCVLERKLLVTACAVQKFKFKIKSPPRLTAVVRLLRAGLSPCKRSCCIPMFLFCGMAVMPQSCFVMRLLCRSCAACRVPCKHSFKHDINCIQCMTLNIFKDCHSGYLNLKIYSPIKFCRCHVHDIFSDIE